MFFDDEYNYLQHLRDTSSVVAWEPAPQKSNDTKLKLPSSVFASVVEEDVGLLNKAAPHSGKSFNTFIWRVERHNWQKCQSERKIW